jgi:TonB-linked SusC/RagA family outer membrane protein
MTSYKTKIICAFAGVLLIGVPLTVTAQEADSVKLVNVAFGQKSADDLLQGVSVVDYKALADKSHNTYSLNDMQGYVGGFNGNSPWASGAYLVVVDGVPRGADNVLPEEIEQVTFLKSAAAVVLYGSQAQKGAVLITTKHGRQGLMRITASGQVGISVAKRLPKYLGSAEYMTLYNEARQNDGLAPLYSDEDIYHYASGENPYRYPNLDLYSRDYIRRTAMHEQGDIEIEGGGERATYYANIGLYHTGNFFKFGEAKNNGVTRLNFRGNVDFTINSFIKAFTRANVTFYDSNTANGSGSYWAQAATLRPNRVSPLIPTSYVYDGNADMMSDLQNSQNIINGSFLGGTTIDQTNVIADMYASGKSKYTSRQFQFDAGVNLDLRSVLEGLSFTSQFSVDYATTYNTAYNNTYATFTPTWSNVNGADMITSLQKVNNDKKTGVQEVSGSTNRQTILFSAQFDYRHTFADVHHLDVKLVGAGWQYTTAGTYHRTSNVNLGLEVDYDFARRYYVQLGMAALHSAKLAEGHRNGLSPSVTLGWKLKNESFLSDVKNVDELTLSTSLASIKSDMDISDYYMYAANYDQSDGAWWGWRDGVSEHSTNSKQGANEDLTFITRKQFTVGARGTFFDRALSAEVTYFHDLYDGGIIKPNTLLPSYFMTYYPEASFIYNMNYNRDVRQGVEFSINGHKRFGEVDLGLGVNGMYYTTKATRRDENYEDAYQNRTGRHLDELWGLKSAGFYKDQADIDASPKPAFGEVKPGDIKYIDQNNDEVIDSRDEVALGRGGWYGSPFNLGINFTAKYKGFTLFVLATGGWGGKAFKNTTYDWVYGDGKYSEVVRNRWTPETASTATYPRLTTKAGDNNFRNSDFWIYSTNRFDLAKMQLTYDMPQKWFDSWFVNGASVYVNGSNLLTFAKERKYMETAIEASPVTRYYELGLKLKF